MTSAPPPGGPSWQHEPAASHPAGPPASSSFFRWLRGLDITRAPDRWVGGVSGGLARRTGLDLALVRGLIVVLAVFGGIGVLLYGLAWALLPEPDGRIHVEQAGRGSWTSGLTGAAALVAIGLWRPNFPFLGDGGAGGLLWTLFWIGAVVLFVYWIVNRSNGGRPRPGFDGGPGGPGAAPNGPQGFGGPGAAPNGPQGFGGPGAAPNGPQGFGGPGAAPNGPNGPQPPFGPQNFAGAASSGPASSASQAADGESPLPPTARSDAEDPSASTDSADLSGSTDSADPSGSSASSGREDSSDPADSSDTSYRTVPLPYRPEDHTATLLGSTGTASSLPTSSYTRPQPLPYGPGVAWSGTSYPPAGGSPYIGPGAVGAAKVHRHRPVRPSGSATALILGGALIVAAMLLALDYANVLDLVNPGVVAFAAAAIILGLGVIVLGIRGRTSGLVGPTAALATVGALVASFTVVGGAWIVAQQSSTTPATLRVAAGGYSVMAAETTIDLTSLPAPARDVVVPVNSLVSDVTVIVPEDVPVEVRTRMALGSADARGTATGFDDVSPRFDSDGGVLQLSTRDLNPEATGAAIVLDVRGAMSDVSIVTAPSTLRDAAQEPSPDATPLPTPTATPTGDTP